MWRLGFPPQLESKGVFNLQLVLDRNDDRQDYQESHRAQQRHELDVLPPHLPLQPPTPHAKVTRSPSELISLVNQEVHPLTPLQQTLNVSRHDSPHIVNLPLRITNRIALSATRASVFHHQILQLAVEASGAIVGHVTVVGAFGELLEEALADLEEVAEGHATAEGGIGHDKESQAACAGLIWVFRGRLGDVVDLMLAMGVGELLRRRVLDLGEDEGGERRGLRGGGGGTFGENSGMMGNAGAFDVSDGIPS